MDISALSSFTLQLPQNQRQDTLERLQRDVQRSGTRSDNDEQASKSLTEQNRSESQSFQRRIESLLETNNSSQAAADDLSFSAQRALQTFNENTPSLQQQLGIELVGIDTFV